MKGQKKIVIGALCMLVMLMAVGYSLLAQQLTINGTANITSTWKVEITNIRELQKSAGVTTNSTNYTPTTASFNTSLTSPGDYAIYEVEVTNLGTLGAVLSVDPQLTKTNTGAILYDIQGIKKGDKLPAVNNNIKKFTIKVMYNPNVTNQQSNVTSSLEVLLNYVQDQGQVPEENIYYAYHSSSLLANQKYDDLLNIVESENTQLYSTNETLIQSHPYYIKYVVSGNDIIERNACFYKDNIETCLLWTNDASSYNTNRQILLDLLGSDKIETDQPDNVVFNIITPRFKVSLDPVSSAVAIYDGHGTCVINAAGSTSCF